MPFAKLKLPREQTELAENQRSTVRTIKCVHLLARHIGNFDAHAQPVKSRSLKILPHIGPFCSSVLITN